MLVLSRAVDEQIVIGDGIVITVCDIRHGLHDKVRIGIAAPREVAVDREEVWLAKRRSQGKPACGPG